MLEVNVSNSLEIHVTAIALNEVLKFKAREKEKDNLVDEDTRDLNDCVNKLDEIIDNQLCDIKRLEDIILLYNKKLAERP